MRTITEDVAGGTFNTSKETEYPPDMCQALCDVAEAIVTEQQLPLGAAQPILAKVHRDTRQLVSEYAHIPTRRQTPS